MDIVTSMVWNTLATERIRNILVKYGNIACIIALLIDAVPNCGAVFEVYWVELSKFGIRWIERWIVWRIFLIFYDLEGFFCLTSNFVSPMDCYCFSSINFFSVPSENAFCISFSPAIEEIELKLLKRIKKGFFDRLATHIMTTQTKIHPSQKLWALKRKWKVSTRCMLQTNKIVNNSIFPSPVPQSKRIE